MKFLCLLGALAFASSLLATPMSIKYNLSGQVVATATQQPLEYTTVSILDLDSTLVDGTITNQEGKFELELNKGDYIIKIDFIGFESKIQSITLDQDLDLGQIQLANNDLTLDAVEVTAEQSQFSVQLDKKVFNVGKDLLSRGGTANEVLDNVPSVAVEPSGAVSLRGNSGVTILINGKPSALADNNALASIPASSIEKVEVITNPSARYESAGNAGIINIVLKANKKRGFNGSATVTAGLPADYQPTFSFNFRREKFNFFGNIGARYANFIGRGDAERLTTLEGITTSFESEYDQDRNDKAAFGFVGLDYFIDEQQTITTSFSNYSVVNTDEQITDFLFRNGDGELTESWEQTFNYREPESYNQLDITYSKKFINDDKKSWRTTFQHDFWFNDETEEMVINELFPSQIERQQLRTNTIESSRDFLLQTDYTTGVAEKGTLEMGLRAETRIIKSDFLAEDQAFGEWQTYQGLDNELAYYERIGGAYLQYGQKFDKFNYLLGLRTEYSFIKVDLQNETDYTKEYTRLFPTANLSYQFTEATGMQLSYSRRIRRPQFWQLNPFAGLSDPNQIFQGNPDMDPAYTDRVELNLVQTSDKWTINPAIYYSSTEAYFGFYLEQQADGLVLEMPVNLEQQQNYGFELLTTYRPNKTLTFNGEFNWFGYDQQGQFQDQTYDFEASTWSSRLTIQYRFLSTFQLQSRFNYQGVFEDAISRRDPIFFADFGLSKQLLDNNLTLTLNLRNAFDSRWYRSTLTQPTFQQERNTAWNVRRWQLTATYQFQQGEGGRLRRARGSIR